MRLPTQNEATEYGFERQLARRIPRKAGSSVHTPRRLLDVGKGANLRFERLIVLALDLQFGLEFLDQQVQVRNLDAQLLNVRGRGSRPNRWIYRLWRAGLCLRRLPGRECFGERTWPG
jgi:hypothetical protein